MWKSVPSPSEFVEKVLHNYFTSIAKWGHEVSKYVSNAIHYSPSCMLRGKWMIAYPSHSHTTGEK